MLFRQLSGALSRQHLIDAGAPGLPLRQRAARRSDRRCAF